MVGRERGGRAVFWSLAPISTPCSLSFLTFLIFYFDLFLNYGPLALVRDSEVAGSRLRVAEPPLPVSHARRHSSACEWDSEERLGRETRKRGSEERLGRETRKRDSEERPERATRKSGSEERLGRATRKRDSEETRKSGSGVGLDGRVDKSPRDLRVISAKSPRNLREISASTAPQSFGDFRVIPRPLPPFPPHAIPASSPYFIR